LLSTLLFLVVVAILLPAVFDLTERVAAPGMNTSLVDQRLNLGFSIVLLLLYAANLIYTLVTHRDMFAGEAPSGKVEWSVAQRWPVGSRPSAAACRTTPSRFRTLVKAGCGLGA
jgi:Ca2+:H+ antiporter